jgi:hypothetical protein
MWGQTATAPSGAAMSQNHEHAAQAAKPEHDMHSMMTKCMESMKKHLPEAEKHLAEMKATLGKMKNEDPAAKHLAELNVQMWEAEVAHMKEMAAMHDSMTEKMDSMREHEKTSK